MFYEFSVRASTSKGRARSSRTIVPRIARTGEGAGSVGAGGVRVARVRVDRALVNVLAVSCWIVDGVVFFKSCVALAVSSVRIICASGVPHKEPLCT